MNGCFYTHPLVEKNDVVIYNNIRKRNSRWSANHMLAWNCIFICKVLVLGYTWAQPTGDLVLAAVGQARPKLEHTCKAWPTSMCSPGTKCIHAVHATTCFVLSVHIFHMVDHGHGCMQEHGMRGQVGPFMVHTREGLWWSMHGLYMIHGFRNYYFFFFFLAWFGFYF